MKATRAAVLAALVLAAACPGGRAMAAPSDASAGLIAVAAGAGHRARR